MIVDDIIQRIQSAYSKGVQSDDSRLSQRHIYNKILTVRSKLLTQQAKKRQKISQWSFQTLSCVELIKAPVHECPCIPPIGCEIFRTKYPLPAPLTDLNQHLLQSVSTVSGSVFYSEIGWNEKKYKADSKYTADKPDYFLRNKYLYLTQKRGAKLIAITGLFQDPWKAHNYKGLCGANETCDTILDFDLPFDEDLLDTLIEMASIELIDQFSQRIEDKTNNSSDSPIEQSK